MKIYAFLFLLIAGIDATAQKSNYSSIDSLIGSLSNKDLFSVVILIAENGHIHYEKAFGYREFDKLLPLQKMDLFEMASVSKQFTAMIIMMLKEQGLLQYDELIDKYLSIPYKGITIRNLLTHTSGLPDYQAIMDQHWDKSKVAGNEDILAYLNQYHPPVLFEPGTQYAYSNTGYVLLASIAEKASGKDFISLCRDKIFSKLKMKHTDIRSLTEKAAITHFAIGHIYVAEKNAFIRADSFPSSNYTIWLGNRKGPGRISSTAEDLLKWDQALYTDKLISQQTLAEAFIPMKLKNGTASNYGFGWVLPVTQINGKIVYHTGDNPGYKTEIIRFIDKKKTLIVLCNNASLQFENIIQTIQSRILQ